MANPEHLKLLQQGRASWNEWRENNPEAVPDLTEAELNETQLIRTDFRQANLTGSSIYGIAAWDVQVDSGTQQRNFIITPPHEHVIVVDNIKVALFIYLLLERSRVFS
jgi:hypothetical protein